MGNTFRCMLGTASYILVSVSFAELRIATVGFVMLFRPFDRLLVSNNSAPTGRIFMKFDISGFFENLSVKLKFN